MYKDAISCLYAFVPIHFRSVSLFLDSSSSSFCPPISGVFIIKKDEKIQMIPSIPKAEIFFLLEKSSYAKRTGMSDSGRFC